jgi:hypothetical protein
MKSVVARRHGSGIEPASNVVYWHRAVPPRGDHTIEATGRLLDAGNPAAATDIAAISSMQRPGTAFATFLVRGAPCVRNRGLPSFLYCCRC